MNVIQTKNSKQHCRDLGYSLDTMFPENIPAKNVGGFVNISLKDYHNDLLKRFHFNTWLSELFSRVITHSSTITIFKSVQTSWNIKASCNFFVYSNFEEKNTLSFKTAKCKIKTSKWKCIILMKEPINIKNNDQKEDCHPIPATQGSIGEGEIT